MQGLAVLVESLHSAIDQSNWNLAKQLLDRARHLAGDEYSVKAAGLRYAIAADLPIDIRSAIFEVIASFPEEAYPFYLLACIEDRDDDYVAAWKAIQEALALDPDKAIYLGQAAHLQLHGFGNYEAAETLARHSLDIDHTHLPALYALYVVARKRDRKDEASDLVKLALSNHPNESLSHLMASQLHDGLGSSDKASEHLFSALALNPNEQSAHNLHARQSINAHAFVRFGRNAITSGLYKFLLAISIFASLISLVFGFSVLNESSFKFQMICLTVFYGSLLIFSLPIGLMSIGTAIVFLRNRNLPNRSRQLQPAMYSCISVLIGWLCGILGLIFQNKVFLAASVPLCLVGPLITLFAPEFGEQAGKRLGVESAIFSFLIILLLCILIFPIHSFILVQLGLPISFAMVYIRSRLIFNEKYDLSKTITGNDFQ